MSFYKNLHGGDKVRGLEGGRGGYGAGLLDAVLLLPYNDWDVTNHPLTVLIKVKSRSQCKVLSTYYYFGNIALQHKYSDYVYFTAEHKPPFRTKEKVRRHVFTFTSTHTSNNIQTAHKNKNKIKLHKQKF